MNPPAHAGPRRRSYHRAVPQTRVLLAGVPDLLRVIVVDAVGRTDDLRVVGEVPSLDAVATARGAAEVDVVIAALDGEHLPASAFHLMYARARLAVLGIVIASGDAQLWQLRPHCTRLGDVSPDELVSAVRAAAAPPPHDGGCP
jgi:hypothetical protein